MPQPSYSSAVGYIGETFFTLNFDIALDGSNTPQLSAFDVQVNGATALVTGIAVNSAAKTVTLSLSYTLLPGDLIDFVYADPTVGDDAQAIQSVDGADASSFVHSIVVAIARPAPAAPSTPALDPASDSGVVGDGVTNFTTPTITGTAQANAVVKLYDTDGATLLGSTTASAGGAWSITSSTLADGSHTLTAKATDSNNNTSSASAGLSFLIDTVAPSTTFAGVSFSSDTGQSSTDFITRTAAQTIAGSLSGALQAGESVQVSLDNGASWSTATATVGSSAWSWTATLTGSSTFKARVVDAAGNAGVAFSQAYVLDTSAPAKPSAPVLSAASDTGSSNSDGITAAAQPSVSGTVEANASVVVYDTDGTTVLGSTVADGSGAWSITSSTLGQGSHTLTVKARDLAGNTSVASDGLSVVIDTTAPVVSVTSPNGDALSAVRTISGTVTDTNAVGTIVSLIEGGQTIGTASVQNDGSWTSSVTLTGYGTHSVIAQSVDKAGNVGSSTTSLVFNAPVSSPPTTPVQPVSPPADPSPGDGFNETKAAMDVVRFFEGAPANSERQVALDAFAKIQFEAYSAKGVLNPSIGAYEAIGRGFAETASFAAKYGAQSELEFITSGYSAVFGRAATPEQVAHFQAQIDYFQALYENANIATSRADLFAKGAVLGQMLGHVGLSIAGTSQASLSAIELI